MSLSLETSTDAHAPKTPSTEASLWSTIRRLVRGVACRRASLREIENMSDRTSPILDSHGRSFFSIRAPSFSAASNLIPRLFPGKSGDFL